MDFKTGTIYVSRVEDEHDAFWYSFHPDNDGFRMELDDVRFTPIPQVGDTVDGHAVTAVELVRYGREHVYCLAVL